MVLKLHRLVRLPPIMTAKGMMVFTSQAGTGLLPRDQGEARLHGETQVSIMDVHVSSCCPEGMGIHEGLVRELLVARVIRWCSPSLGPPRKSIPRPAADRPIKTHDINGVHRCLSSVRKLLLLDSSILLTDYTVGRSPRFPHLGSYTRPSWTS